MVWVILKGNVLSFFDCVILIIKVGYIELAVGRN